jgi:D-cysteine desulfhydrase family pyridoxal phosphate-dependent enzyme
VQPAVKIAGMPTTPWSELPRATLAELPTPLHPLPRFSAAIGAEVWIKRDDAGELGLAGNKVRKLEFVLADARHRGADVVVIVGAAQSNAARASAAACVRLGLRCVLVLSGDPPPRTAGNLLLDRLFGADVRFAGTTDWGELEQAAEQVRDDLRAQGASPYALPAGASSPLGTVGFAAAWQELIEQLDAHGVAASTLIHASSSGGTHAGLILGRALSGGGPRVRAIGVAADIYPDTPAQIVALASEAAGRLDADVEVEPGDLSLDMGFLGDGYAIPTPEAVAAIRLLAETEAIVCDPVYSGKALAAVVAGAREGALPGTTVFWHTGGYHAVFALPFGDALLDGG